MADRTDAPNPYEPICSHAQKRGYAWRVLSVLIFAFGMAVWIGFWFLPRANPWMMGEVAFTRLLVINVVMFAGSIVAILLAGVVWFQNRPSWLLLASLPCLLYVAMIVVSMTRV